MADAPGERLIDEAWDAVTQTQGDQCNPYYCPTAGDVECCPTHSGWMQCCDRPELHRPIEEGMEVRRG